MFLDVQVEPWAFGAMAGTLLPCLSSTPNAQEDPLEIESCTFEAVLTFWQRATTWNTDDDFLCGVVNKL